MCEKSPEIATNVDRDGEIEARSASVEFFENVEWLRRSNDLIPLYESANNEHFSSLGELLSWLEEGQVKLAFFQFAARRSSAHLKDLRRKVEYDTFQQLVLALSDDVMEVFEEAIEKLLELNIDDALAEESGARSDKKKKPNSIERLLVAAARENWSSISATVLIDAVAIFISGTAHKLKFAKIFEYKIVLAGDIRVPGSIEDAEQGENSVDDYPDGSTLSAEEIVSQKQEFNKFRNRRLTELERAQQFEQGERERLRRSFATGLAGYSDNMFDAVLEYARVNLSRDGVGNYGVSEEIAKNHRLKRNQLENYLEALRGKQGKWARFMERHPLPWDHDGTVGPLGLPNFRVKSDGSSTEDRTDAEFRSRDGWSIR